MKRTVSVIAILTLAACGGGSGGGDGGAPRVVGSLRSDYVQRSNSVITSMVSNSEKQVAIYVSDKLHNPVTVAHNLGRSPTGRDGMPGSIYADIDYETAQVLIELAEWLANPETSASAIETKFATSDTDKYNIKNALKLLGDTTYFVDNDAQTTASNIVAHRGDDAFVAALAELRQHAEIMTLDRVGFVGIDEGFGLEFKFEIDEDGKITSISMLDEPTAPSTITDAELRGELYHDIAEKLIEFDMQDELATIGITELTGTEETDMAAIVTALGNAEDETVVTLQTAINNRLKQDGMLYFTRNGDDTNSFAGKINASDGFASVQMVYNSQGGNLGAGNAGKKLKYSDFGFLEIQHDDSDYANENRRIPFAAGYNVDKEIGKDAIVADADETEITFNGRAVGDVLSLSEKPTDPNETRTVNNLPLDGTAQLVFDTANDTGVLTATFDNWYTVTYDDTANTLAFTDAGKVDDDYALLSTETTLAPTGAQVNYYGDNNSPIEATGLIQLRDCGAIACPDNDDAAELRMNMAFGVKK